MYKTKPCIRLYVFALIYTGTFNVVEIFWKDGPYNPYHRNGRKPPAAFHDISSGFPLSAASEAEIDAFRWV